ncbi:hypothetical protein [Aggregatilinea lenta]|uniref:hypothetical protein n=1 Tax=Aggregatilinea lenta TaxID=913108 RepID=UPI0013C2A6F9|nr:hypothetical protein [Aggregatilinea lenta]
MLPEYNDSYTRIWWNDSEVVFIAWTESALVFRWPEGAHNNRGIIQLPRGATRRLAQRGILRIDGDAPGWFYGRITAPVEWEELPPARPAAPPPPPPRPTPARMPRPALRDIVGRIIRKLTGDDELRPLRASAAAGPDVDHPTVRMVRPGSR